MPFLALQTATAMDLHTSMASAQCGLVCKRRTMSGSTRRVEELAQKHLLGPFPQATRTCVKNLQEMKRTTNSVECSQSR